MSTTSTTDPQYQVDGVAHNDPQPAHDPTAEQAVLGAAMLSADALGELAEALPVGDLYRPAHQAVYQACLDLYAEGAPVDPITVGAELDKRGELSRVGGAPYLHTCIAAIPTATSAGYYADIVSDKAGVRRMVEAGSRIAQLGQWASSDAAVAPELSELVNRAQHALDQVTGSDHGEEGAARFVDMVQPTLDKLDAVQTGTDDSGIPTGIADLDRMTTGFYPGQLVTVAARPGFGKSALAIQFARHASIRLGLASAIFSLEMGKQEIMLRMLAAETKVRLHTMRSKGHMSDDDWARLGKTIAELDDPPLYIDDSPGMTITGIRARARRWKQRHGLRLIVVDYLQLLTSTGKERREQEVAEFSRQLKLLAKELEVPVIALSQLNRGSENRADKRPLLADLRESGAIEQDSDIVILMDRPDAREQDDPRAGEVDLVLAKHRDGPMGTVTVAHQLHYSRFANLAAE